MKIERRFYKERGWGSKEGKEKRGEDKGRGRKRNRGEERRGEETLEASLTNKGNQLPFYMMSRVCLFFNSLIYSMIITDYF